MEYITISGITSIHLKQFPSGVLQPYIDEANRKYEDICYQLGISSGNIYTPIPISSIRYLQSYILSRFAEDSICSNNLTVNDDDMYLRLKNMADENCTDYLKDLTPELVSMVQSNDRQSRAVNTGKLYRDS